MSEDESRPAKLKMSPPSPHLLWQADSASFNESENHKAPAWWQAKGHRISSRQNIRWLRQELPFAWQGHIVVVALGTER